MTQLEAMHRSVINENSIVSQAQTPSERELTLKIRLAELQLEQQKLLHSHNCNGLAAGQVNQIGVVSWEVVKWTQQARWFIR